MYPALSYDEEWHRDRDEVLPPKVNGIVRRNSIGAVLTEKLHTDDERANALKVARKNRKLL